MSTPVENTSTYCDRHPAQAAGWYCYACFKFLCEACTTIGTQRRLCLACKLPCRDLAPKKGSKPPTQNHVTPSALTFPTAPSGPSESEEQMLAKALITRQKERLEKERLERETRLKSRIEARRSGYASSSLMPGVEVPSGFAYDAPAGIPGPVDPSSPPSPAGQSGQTLPGVAAGPITRNPQLPPVARTSNPPSTTRIPTVRPAALLSPTAQGPNGSGALPPRVASSIFPIHPVNGVQSPPPIEDPELARELELRMKDQITREKTDRETRMRPTALTRRVALPPALRGTGSDVHPTTPYPAVSSETPRAGHRVADVEQAPEIPLEPIIDPGGTMYNPAAPFPGADSGTLEAPPDPLYQLGERAHLTAVWGASSFVLLVGVVLVLSHLALSYLVLDEEREWIRTSTEVRAQTIEKMRQKITETDAIFEKELLERDLKALIAAEANGTPVVQNGLVALKYIYGGTVALGALMFALSFATERFPFGALAGATGAYALATVAILFVRINPIEILCRCAVLIPLYRGVLVGYRLHRFRTDYVKSSAQ